MIDMVKFSECLDIIDVIIENGGYDTVRNFLASQMANNADVYDNVLNGRIHGEQVKDLI